MLKIWTRDCFQSDRRVYPNLQLKAWEEDERETLRRLSPHDARSFVWTCNTGPWAMLICGLTSEPCWEYVEQDIAGAHPNSSGCASGLQDFSITIWKVLTLTWYFRWWLQLASLVGLLQIAGYRCWSGWTSRSVHIGWPFLHRRNAGTLQSFITMIDLKRHNDYHMEKINA